VDPPPSESEGGRDGAEESWTPLQVLRRGRGWGRSRGQGPSLSPSVIPSESLSVSSRVRPRLPWRVGGVDVWRVRGLEGSRDRSYSHWISWLLSERRRVEPGKRDGCMGWIGLFIPLGNAGGG
jgi:hypothetical protein